MALRGEFAGPRRLTPIGDYMVGGDDIERINADKVRTLLEQPPRTRALNTEEFSSADLVDYLWLQGDSVLVIFTSNPNPPFSFAYGLCDREYDSVILLQTQNFAGETPTTQTLTYGSDAAWELLQMRVNQFVAEGGPSLTRGIVAAYPSGYAPTSKYLARKRWMDYIIMPAFVV
jgi:hypothetical protein